MAEGHVVHRAAREANATLVGAPVAVSSPQGKAAREAALLDGLTLVSAEAWGKHLFYEFAPGPVLHVHLGLAGTLARVSTPDVPPRRQARLRLANAVAAFDLYAPSTCEVGDRALRDHVVARLGPDPLRADADRDLAWARLLAHRGAIGAALLDQTVVSGVGNVLRAEVLHLVGVHPERPASDLERGELDALWSTLVDVMRRAVDEGRIVTRPPRLRSGGRSGARTEGRWVYKQPVCRRCGAQVEEAQVGGRTAYACPRCQPRRAVVERTS